MTTHQDDNWQSLFERMFTATKLTQSNLEAMARDLANMSASFKIVPQIPESDQPSVDIATTLKQIADRLDGYDQAFQQLNQRLTRLETFHTGASSTAAEVTPPPSVVAEAASAKPPKPKSTNGRRRSASADGAEAAKVAAPPVVEESARSRSGRMTHPAEQKQEALERIAAGESVTNVARDLNVNYKTVFSWKQKAEQVAAAAAAANPPPTPLAIPSPTPATESDSE